MFDIYIYIYMYTRHEWNNIFILIGFLDAAALSSMCAHLDTWLLSLITGNLPTPIPKVFPIRPGTQGQEQEQARKEEGRQVKGQLQAFRCEERDFEKGGPEGQGFG